jgi:ATP-binding cassette, subfamily B, multidrug efflux pump
MKRLWFYLRQHVRRSLWGLFLLILTTLVAMSVPQLFLVAIDSVASGAPVGEIQEVAVVLLAVALSAAILRVMSRVHLLYVARDVEMGLRLDLFEHLSRLEPRFYRDHPTGDLMSRATNDLTQVRLLIGAGVLNTVNTVVAYVAAVPLMMAISVRLTLVSLALFPPAIWVMRRLGRVLYVYSREAQEAMGRLSNAIQESLTGAHVVRAFAVEPELMRRFDLLSQAYYDVNLKLTRSRSALFGLGLVTANLAILAALYFGARGVLAKELTVGQVVALTEYMALLSWPTLALGWVLSLWQRGAASMARINAILETEPQIRSGSARPVEVTPELATRGLTIEHDGRAVVDGLTLSVPAGATIGVVGPVGSGKSTLAKALLRLVEVAPGQVFVGGHDVCALDLATLRGVFGYVPQEPLLFSRTLAENAAFGRPEATRAEILQVLERAAFAADLAALPLGLDTPVGERGITLSGGQKQRVAIARALLIEPPILVLDDALSSLDAETEAEVLRSLRRARAGRTTIIISHRVTAVAEADQILVLDRGRLAASGRHAELRLVPGIYAQMVRRQELERSLQASLAESLEVAAS